MTEQDARAILKTALETSQMLDLLAADVATRMGHEESRAVRLNIGHVVGEILERLLDPAFDEFPQYKPDNTGDAWRELARSVGARDMREV